MATIRNKLGHLETLPIDLLYEHLDASFIFNHLETMNGSPNFSSATAPRQKITCGDMAQFVTNRCHTPTWPKPSEEHGICCPMRTSPGEFSFYA
jgi:hypothetical protein